MDKKQLLKEKENLLKQYDNFKESNIKLDLSRGKPGNDQLKISEQMLDSLNASSEYMSENGFDCRNYGLIEGLPKMRRIFGKILGVDENNVIIGGNSSLSMMFDTISSFMTNGVNGLTPWFKQDKIKFLCPVPGYDRHFSILEYFGIEMVCVNMTPDGPDMDTVENLVNNDSQIKGIWCVPKYSNPQGITYSDEVVKRFAKLTPKAKDFRIFWDNAYAIHDITDTPDKLLNIAEECKKYGNEDIVLQFCSTSKVTFPGSGVSCIAASENNLNYIKKRLFVQTIGYDKLNQLRHILFFRDYEGVLKHMEKHKSILKPKFDIVLNSLNYEFSDNKIVSWLEPNGGYFVSIDVLPGCAKKVVELCKEANVVLTPAGSTYPYKSDPNDSNIRIAPTYPPINELKIAMDILCVSIKLVTIEKLLQQN